MDSRQTWMANTQVTNRKLGASRGMVESKGGSSVFIIWSCCIYPTYRSMNTRNLLRHIKSRCWSIYIRIVRVSLSIVYHQTPFFCAELKEASFRRIFWKKLAVLSIRLFFSVRLGASSRQNVTLSRELYPYTCQPISQCRPAL